MPAKSPLSILYFDLNVDRSELTRSSICMVRPDSYVTLVHSDQELVRALGHARFDIVLSRSPLAQPSAARLSGDPAVPVLLLEPGEEIQAIQPQPAQSALREDPQELVRAIESTVERSRRERRALIIRHQYGGGEAGE